MNVRASVTVLIALSLGCGSESKGGDSTHPGGTTPNGGTRVIDSPEWPGFVRLNGLGVRCTAALARNAAEHYTALSFIPCSSGATACAELKWDGALSWDPTGSGDLLEFHAQLARDAEGKASRLLVVKRYPRGDGYQGLPFEAVAYDLAAGTPLLALRNDGDEFVIEDDGYVSGGSGGRDCEIEPVVTARGVWLAGNPSGSIGMSVGRIAFGGGAQMLRPINATTGVLDGTRSDSFDDSGPSSRLVASDEILGLEETDGRILRVGADSAFDLSTYGPDIRVWLTAALGRELVAFSPQQDGDYHVRLTESGEFASLASSGRFLRFDGVRAAWLQASSGATDTFEVWTAPYRPGDGAMGEGKAVAVISAQEVKDVSLADGVLAVVTTRYTSVDTAYLVDLDTGHVSARKLESEVDDPVELVGNDATHLYLIEGFERSALRRYVLD